MTIYLLIGLVALYLIYSNISKNKDENSENETPPIFDRKGSRSLFETIINDIFDDKKEEKHFNFQLKNQNKVQNKVKKDDVKNNEVKDIKIDEKKEIKQDITDEFDLRKAIIYSEILNNPYIKK
ncbi:MAG: hypothetical protein H6Q15_673 [Bacteroidetes bacterium]|nr:hypothetical protein [Bacteroidota bacterium]